MAQVRKRQVHFDDYKAIKDEIIEISEQRFENILTRRLKEFKVEFKEELMNDINQRFKIVFWILGAFITIYIATYSILLNIILEK